jgi:hypothetical protein
MAQAPHELPPPMPKDTYLTSLAAVPGMADQKVSPRPATSRASSKLSTLAA